MQPESFDRDRLVELVQLVLSRLEARSSAAQGVAGSDSDLLALCAGAFGMGLLRGRWGKVAPFGIPLDLGLGAFLHLLGLSGLAGSETRAVKTLSRAALATYCATWGASIGNRLKLGLPVNLRSESSNTASAEGDRTSNGAHVTPSTQEVVESIRSIVMN